MKVFVGVLVNVSVGVFVGVLVGTPVAVMVLVDVAVPVCVGVGVFVTVGWVDVARRIGCSWPGQEAADHERNLFFGGRVQSTVGQAGHLADQARTGGQEELGLFWIAKARLGGSSPIDFPTICNTKHRLFRASDAMYTARIYLFRPVSIYSGRISSIPGGFCSFRTDAGHPMAFHRRI